MASDASHMLEAALEQMDDIIAGSKAAADYSNGLFEIGSPVAPPYLRSLQILQLVEELRVGLELMNSEEEVEEIRNQIPTASAQAIIEWLDHFSGNRRATVNNESYQDRLTRLESDKESLVLQVSVLTDQVEAQGEKIRDLEACLEEHQLKLNSTEEMLQQELISRTALESQKLDLMAEVSNLKIKLAGIEKDQEECEEKSLKNEGLLLELRSLKCKVEELENEKNQYEKKLKTTKAEITELQEQLLSKDMEIERLQSQLSSRASVQSDGSDREDMYRRKLKEKHQEVQRLKVGLDSLLAANEEKDRRIEELSRLLNQYKMMKQMVLMAQGPSDRRPLGSSEEELSMCSMVRSPTNTTHSEAARSEISPPIPSPSVDRLTSPVEFETRNVQLDPEKNLSPYGDKPSNRHWLQQRQMSSSLEELTSERVEKSKAYLDNNKYQTLPGKLSQSNHHRDAEHSLQRHLASPVQNTMTAVTEDWDNSIPNLRETERSVDSTFSSPELSPMSTTTETDHFPAALPENRKNTKGLKKFLGKIRRTHSSTLAEEEEGPTEFRRGGLRATAGPCLARSTDTSGYKGDPKVPFAQWTTEQVCSWLQDCGLGQYAALARQWVTSGQTLLSATPQELEKELGIKHSLHRKKIQLVQKTIGTKQDENPGKLDHIWVTRWLDDIGLPQYKDQFNEARVDGRMLQYLTVNDLLFLKVTSQLHHLSIKCAIHVLHVNKFNPNCLRRRPADESKVSPSDVAQWSNHRVMEWLRSVDLAEYAPNLRGSGVHGGLAVLEPRFNSETLALLLNIPPQKTLLRRHLTTHFNLLIGPESQHEKREILESSSYTPLNTTAKVRPKKLGFSHFGNLRKKKLDECTDYICPLDTIHVTSNGSQKSYAGYRGKKAVVDRELNKLEQMEDSERAVQQIGALSESINNLTSRLTRDDLLKDYWLKSLSTTEGNMWH
eukprot:gi/632941676/ref/XP_007885991.1/ PREDICTED: liprin-beta-2 isoform X2 [Callorhinchus milii]